MDNYIRIPLALPFKFVQLEQPKEATHFDEALTCRLLKNWQYRAAYMQKWQRTDTTKLQVESTIPPQPLQVLRMDGTTAKTIAWTPAFNGTAYKIYELDFTVADLPAGKYFLYLQVTLLAINWEFISEPIATADTWRNTLFLRYRNSYNAWDVAWSTGVEFGFRVEAAIVEPNFERERSAYVNQTRSITTLSGVPYRSFTFAVGLAAGVAPYIVDTLNRIFVCDRVLINGLQYETEGDAKFEITRAKGYPLIGASIGITEASNRTSTGKARAGSAAAGIISAYNIETGFFGGATIVPIIDKDKSE